MEGNINSRIDNLIFSIEREMGKNSIDEVKVTDENGLLVELVCQELRRKDVYETILSSNMTSDGNITNYTLVVSKNYWGDVDAGL